MAQKNLTDRMKDLEKTIGEFVKGMDDRVSEMEKVLFPIPGPITLNPKLDPLLLDIEMGIIPEDEYDLDEVFGTPKRHMRKWTDEEKGYLEHFIKIFAKERAEKHQRTKEAIYFKIIEIMDDMELESNNFGGRNY